MVYSGLCVYFMTGTPKGSTESDSGEARFKPAIPGLQGIALIHYTTIVVMLYFCGRVPWLYQYWPGGFMLFVVLCPGTPEGSTGSGSGFKASQKTGQRLKVSSDRLGEAGNRTCDPWFTRHRFIPYTKDIGLFPTPRRLLYCCNVGSKNSVRR